MPTVSAHANVAASPSEVFDFLADYRNISRVQPQFTSVRLISPVEQGVGAVVELQGRFHSMPVRVHSRIITFVPPRRLVSISEGTILSRNAWELEPLDGQVGTRVTFKVDYKAGGPLGAVFTGIASSLFHREIEAMTGESLRRLRECFA
ncbi:MAG TPA: SRPBCC family protein [Chloroflexia bacterium]|nr:SRPBCC family protein [Chloroflexia bacterium]